MEQTNQPFDDTATSGDHPSIWTITAPADPSRFGPVAQPLQTDVLVVGGGIAGLLTAYRLLERGRSVIVVEDGNIGSGETGRTSAHLTWSLDTQYCDLEQRFGAEKAALIADAHESAIVYIESVGEQERIDCRFRRIDGYLFAHPTDEEDTVRREYETLSLLGLPNDLLEEIPGFAKGGRQRCLRYPNQAQFHPLLFLQGLADAVVRKGGQIYTGSKAKEFADDGVKVNGWDVKANHIVLATNTPIAGSLVTHTRQWPYRTFAIAAEVPKGSIAPALWWDTGDRDVPWAEKPYHYVRVEEGTDCDYLIVGGEDHRTGQEDREDIPAETRFARLEAWTKAHFDGVTGIAARWSGQVINSVDGIGLVGRNPGSENLYVITGDTGNGLTNAGIGALLVTDLIDGKNNKWESVFDPSRHVATKAPGTYFKEAGNMVRQYTDWLLPGDRTTIEELQPGQGAVLREGLKKLAVYRDEAGEVHVCTAVCPHLGAIVQWNDAEKTFDCPAHGSRFTALGKVINGPSNGNLGEPDV